MERTIAGRYALRWRLGVGAMGDVYAADDLRLDREVAVKLVPEAGITEVARARFVREARAAARFNHPNAVAVYDAGDADGFLFLVMERVSGHTLADRLAQHGPLRVPEAAAIATAVLAALGAAHAAGVVHRDVKPANILVGPAGVKLVDFGIATLVGQAASNVTAVGDVVGTPKYLAPEQIAGQPATPATDLYAVGVVLFEMLSGVVPFDRGSPVATALAHRDEAAPDVRAIRPDVPPRVAAVIHTALQKRPADRYQSAAEMRNAIAPAAASDYAGETAVFSDQALMVPGGRSRRAWWFAAVAAVVGGGVAVGAILAGDDDELNTAPTSTPAGVSSTAAPSTTLAATTMPPAMASATTTAALATAPPVPESVEQLMVVLAADPSRYGPATAEAVDRLGELDNRGRRSRDRATELLESAQLWVDEGQLTVEALELLEPVLAPLARDENSDDDDDESGDD